MTTRDGLVLLAVAAGGGLVGAMALALLTAWISTWGPTSPDGQFSLRGNGALVVPVAGGLTLVTMWWTGVVLRWSRSRRPVELALAAGLFELVVAALGAALLPIYSAPATHNLLVPLSNGLDVIAFVWPLAAPLAAAFLLGRSGTARESNGWTAGALLLFPAVLLVALYAAGPVSGMLATT